MVNGKIKEWHLEAELLQKLISGGSSDFTEALRDYIKKTDIIESSQLSEEFLASIENKLQAIRDNIRNNYRNKDTAITEDDLDESLQVLLETFYQSQEFSGFTRQEVEDIFFAYITDTIEQYDRFDNIEQNIKNNVQQEIQPVLNDMSDRIETAENQVNDLRDALDLHQEEAENSYRKKSDYIDEEDIDPIITRQIQNNKRNIQNLQNQVNELVGKSLDIHGTKNQILVIGYGNSVEASNVVTKLNIATTEEELSLARASLINPIYSFVFPQSIYEIQLNGWNSNAGRTSKEETVPVYNLPEQNAAEESYVPLSYKDYILNAANIRINGLTVQIGDTISATNGSEIDRGSIVIGFYGTRFKLYSSLQETEQNFQVVIDNDMEYNIVLQEKSLFTEDIETDHVCCCCIENLSEGLHAIRIIIDPGKSLVLDNKISLDDGTHSDLLDAADIPNDEFFEQTMFDTGDYVGSLSRQYSFVKSEDLHIVTSSDYESSALEIGGTGYEKKLLYAVNSKKLFYMDDTGILITLSSPYETKLAELEARIAALEA